MSNYTILTQSYIMSSGILGPPNTDVATPLATQTAAARNAPAV